jgi:peptidoglycan-associated lipoprotein
MKKLVISLVLVNLLAACASNKPAETTAAAGSDAASAASTKAAAAAATDALNDPSSILAKRSVFYPFDVSAVQDADKPAVQAHGQYLANNANR